MGLFNDDPKFKTLSASRYDPEFVGKDFSESNDSIFAGKKRFASNILDMDNRNHKSPGRIKTIDEESERKLAKVLQERSNYRKLKRLKLHTKENSDKDESDRSSSPSLKFWTPDKDTQDLK